MAHVFFFYKFKSLFELIFSEVESYAFVWNVFFKVVFKNNFLKLFFNVLHNKNLFKNLKFFKPVFYVFKYVLQITYIYSILFLIILHIYVAI